MNDFSIQKEKAREKMLEALLEYAGACHAEYTADAMKAADEPEGIGFPSELDARLKKYMRRHSAEEKLKKVFKATATALPRVAVIFFAVFLSFAVLLSSVEAFRARVLNFIIEAGKEYTSIDLKETAPDTFEEALSGIPPEWEHFYVPDYIPEGFKMTKAESLMVTKIIHYSNDKGLLIVFQQHDGRSTNIRVDTEDAVSEKISISGREGLLVEKKGLTTLVWHNDDFSFSLFSGADKKELLKMAESLKQKK